MSISISISGRVCLCEWSGPVTVAMIISLLSRLKKARESQGAPLLLVLNVNPSAARSLLRSPCAFLNTLPAIMDGCYEILVASDEDNAYPLGKSIRATLALSTAKRTKSVQSFALLDDALIRAQTTLPHEVIELRCQRIRSGVWTTRDVLKNAYEQDVDSSATH
jgi:hypothetical protein